MEDRIRAQLVYFSSINLTQGDYILTKFSINMDGASNFSQGDDAHRQMRQQTRLQSIQGSQ